MTTRHSTEALARKAARRLGNEPVHIIGTRTDYGIWTYHVLTGPDCQRPEGAPWAAYLYRGPGYLCPKEVQ